MQDFAQYHLNKSSKYEAGTTEELLKGGTFSFNKVLFIVNKVCTTRRL